ncbi:MAG: rod shape-determining protein MreD [Bacteroidetes bacterium]|nr:MAG: rod shape-determining protein MreD [Bacteroidota bacterium]
MIKLILRNIWRFAILVILQVILFNNIQFSGYINPYFYIIFILLLPFETPKWILMLSSFLLGLSIDIFSNTIGMHASACVFIAFLRPHILQYIAPREGYEASSLPRIHYYGFSWFLKYSTILILAHHIFLFYIEVYTFSGFFYTLSRALLSSIFTIILIVFSQYIVYRK